MFSWFYCTKEAFVSRTIDVLLCSVCAERRLSNGFRYRRRWLFAEGLYLKLLPWFLRFIVGKAICRNEQWNMHVIE